MSGDGRIASSRKGLRAQALSPRVVAGTFLRRLPKWAALSKPGCALSPPRRFGACVVEIWGVFCHIVELILSRFGACFVTDARVRSDWGGGGFCSEGRRALVWKVDFVWKVNHVVLGGAGVCVC